MIDAGLLLLKNPVHARSASLRCRRPSQSDPTAALAAALILAGSFPDLVSWAVRVFDAAIARRAPTASRS